MITFPIFWHISLEADDKKSTRPSPGPHRELDAKLDLIRPFLNTIIVNFSRTTDWDIERKDQQDSWIYWAGMPRKYRH